MPSSELGLLVLQGLRLAGFASPTDISTMYSLPLAEVDSELAAQEMQGHVVYRQGMATGWTLTASGRLEGERRLADELDRYGLKADIAGAYAAFKPVNTELLTVCSKWQVVDVELGLLNNHDNQAYDDEVQDELRRIHSAIIPIVDLLAESLDRLSIHGDRLRYALHRVNRGESAWFTGARIDSYHTVWFQMHEDLLATLGLERADETG